MQQRTLSIKIPPLKVTENMVHVHELLCLIEEHGLYKITHTTMMSYSEISHLSITCWTNVKVPP
jgi:hypothetical protein